MPAKKEHPLQPAADHLKQKFKTTDRRWPKIIVKPTNNTYARIFSFAVTSCPTLLISTDQTPIKFSTVEEEIHGIFGEENVTTAGTGGEEEEYLVTIHFPTLITEITSALIDAYEASLTPPETAD